jgi:hypothetical protein
MGRPVSRNLRRDFNAIAICAPLLRVDGIVTNFRITAIL